MSDTPEEQFVKAGAEKVKDTDIQKVVDRSEEIKQKFSARGPLRRFIEDGKVLLALVKDYRTGVYRNVLYGTVAAVVFALIYVFNPFDIVPDVLPIVGEIDDAAVVAACLALIERDLHKYRDWKISHPGKV